MLIRAPRPDDAADISQTMAHPGCYGNTLQMPYPTEQMWHKRLASPPDNLHVLVVELQGRVVANGGLQLMSNARRRHVANLGMAVHPEFQGQGVGSALLAALLELADNWLAVHRVELEVFVDNEAALALYRKHGFEEEGTARDYAFRGGRYVDAVLMARVRAAATSS